MLIKLRLPQFWYHKNIISWLILPFSFIYLFFIFIRRIYYKLIPIPKFKVPIIVVGNITVGGTGKTPLVIALTKLLKTKGYKPGIICRGYRGNRGNKSITVTKDSKVDEVGDESLVIFNRTGSPVAVNSNRVAAVKTLLANNDCNVVISDDGLQHYRLDRYIEIVIVDDSFEFGNRFCLPAGPLREPISRLNSVDFIIRNMNLKSVTVTNNNEYPMVITNIVFRNIINPSLTKIAADFNGLSIDAVAGIGLPEKFFATLESLNLSITKHPFPDHHKFLPSDFQFAQENVIIMTEKDAIKCLDFANENFWYMEVDVKLEDGFISNFLNKLALYQ